MNGGTARRVWLPMVSITIIKTYHFLVNHLFHIYSNSFTMPILQRWPLSSTGLKGPTQSAQRVGVRAPDPCSVQNVLWLPLRDPAIPVCPSWSFIVWSWPYFPELSKLDSLFVLPSKHTMLISASAPVPEAAQASSPASPVVPASSRPCLNLIGPCLTRGDFSLCISQPPRWSPSEPHFLVFTSCEFPPTLYQGWSVWPQSTRMWWCPVSKTRLEETLPLLPCFLLGLLLWGKPATMLGDA